ncbi:hypothetical protein [Weissella paramesenteroides]|uniref:Uncharacterized protein n=1 Tax=Weissella paramesenteroides ATCC 33313 TaxID=585506 RepID=C5RBU3_WEIPA|nr:hypothetical protein [Weissella paramesenteroides]ATF41206.1 hypothetical protein CO680_03730 [Weissella paramesenteroides]EER74338.1 hypothetical protein HMPREF0877_1439 [Weissella paramesenteroides ATCC 33313]
MGTWRINREFFITETEKFMYFHHGELNLKIPFSDTQRQEIQKLLSQQTYLDDKEINGISNDIKQFLITVGILIKIKDLPVTINRKTKIGFELGRKILNQKNMAFSNDEGLFVYYSVASEALIFSQYQLVIFQSDVTSQLIQAVNQILEHDIETLKNTISETGIVLIKLNDYTRTFISVTRNLSDHYYLMAIDELHVEIIQDVKETSLIGVKGKLLSSPQMVYVFADNYDNAIASIVGQFDSNAILDYTIKIDDLLPYNQILSPLNVQLEFRESGIVVSDKRNGSISFINEEQLPVLVGELIYDQVN